MTTHPPDILLQAFSLGTAEPHDVAAIEAHLEGCSECCSRVEAAADDPFLSRLRLVAGQVPQTDTVNVHGPTPLPGSDAPPAMLGGYRIVAELGRGGMGVVYRGHDDRLDRPVALKVMLPQFAARPGASERFLREARAAARIAHDNVVTVYEADESDGVPYIAMQFLQGCPLDAYLKQQDRPALAQVLRIARETAAGLAAAHKIGLVHRDIKPANLWLEEPDGRVKVLDFGLAKPVDAQVELTGSGAVIGTPAYMSPEQARGEKVDHRTDLFSLGAVLYRLCTRRLPFQGTTTMAMLTALATEQPPPVRNLNPAVPQPLAELIHQLLAKVPAARPQSADEVVERVRDIDAGTAPARHRPARSSRWVAAGLAGLLAITVCGLIIIIRSKDGTESKIELPEGAAMSIQNQDGKALTTVEPAADPNRKAAEWVLSLGGTVRVNGQAPEFKAGAVLPKGRFTLTGINLDKTSVTDAGLARLKDVQRLTELRLMNTQVTDVGLAHVKHLTGVKFLSLERTRVTDTTLAQLGNFKGLAGLGLNGTPVSDAGLAHLKGLPALSDLDLTSTRITDVGLAHLKELRSLRRLYLSGTPVADTGLAYLKELPGLKLLGVQKTRVTAKGIDDFRAAVPGCNVQHSTGTIQGIDVDRKAAEWALALGGMVQVDRERRDLKAATELPKDPFTLTMVFLNNKPVTDADLAILKDCKGLIDLRLYGTKVTDAGLVHLGGLRGLAHLYLGGTPVTDAGLAKLKDLQGLTGLYLFSTKIADGGLVHLGGLTGLALLNLQNTQVTDAGLASLGGLKELTHLYLGRTKVTDAGLVYLKGLTRLNYLDLNATAVTDVGLTHLKDCARLEFLHVKGTAVTEKGLEAFQAAVPGCMIEHDGGTIQPKK